jgi:hypothetical protein
LSARALTGWRWPALPSQLTIPHTTVGGTPNAGTRGITPHPTLVQKALLSALLAAAIPKAVGCHTYPNGLPPMVFSSLLLLAADAAPKRLRPEAPAAAPVAMVRG